MRKITENKLIVASHNKSKIKEICDLLTPYGLSQVVSGTDYGLEEPVEDGATFVANAEIKSRYFAGHTGELSLADDAGLCVDSLSGKPGIHSARYAELPDGSRDFDWAMQKMQQQLIDVSGTDKGHKAHFICVLSLCWADGHVQNFEGRVDGTLRFPPAGEFGFGYDPIFVPDGYDSSFGEESVSQLKNSIGHRAIAFQKLVDSCF